MSEDIERMVAGLARDEGIISPNEHPRQQKEDVIHVVSFPHREYRLVIQADVELAASYHVPHQFYDYQYHRLLSQGFENGFTFENIHTQFDRKDGYGGYFLISLPEAIAKQVYGEAYQGGSGE